MSRFFAATGRFAVRFRWVVVAAWIAATIAASHLFPSLASVANAGGGSQLPAGSPSEHAALLARPFQQPGLTPVPVAIATRHSALTSSGLTAIGRLASSLGTVTGVRHVSNLGVSRDDRAALLQVQARVNLNADGPDRDLVAGLRNVIHSANLPAGLRVHLAGPVAAGVDASQSSHRSANLGEYLSIVFILLALLGGISQYESTRYVEVETYNRFAEMYGGETKPVGAEGSATA